MRGRLILTLLLPVSLLLPAGSLAQSAAEAVQLDSRSFTRSFDRRQVDSDIRFSAGGNFTSGQRSYLLIDIDSTPSNALASELAGAVVVNGFVVIGLPPGLEPDGEPRLFYYDSQKSRYEFMYSKAFPNLTKLEGLGDALEAAASNDPQRILDGLNRISGALDPAVHVAGPTDARLSGADPSYSVSGVSWLIPCNVWFDSLVSLFDPEDSYENNPRLRISLPVKVASQINEPKVALYVGGLSAAVAKVELLPADIPPTAIPLAPLPEPAAAPTSVPQAGAPAAEASDSPPTANPPSTGDSMSGAGEARPRRPSQADSPDDVAGQQPPPRRTPPAAEAEAAPPPPPTPIPVLIYSYEWLAWETMVDISQVLGLPAPLTSDSGLPAVTVAPAEESLAELAQSADDPADDLPTVPAATQVDVAVSPEVADAGTPETAKPDQAPANAVSAPEVTQPQAAELQQAPLEQATGVREVQPGTLPEVQESYTVDLKPITGSGNTGSTATAGADMPAGVPDFRPADGSASPGQLDSNGGLPSSINGLPGGAVAPGPPPEDMGEMVLIPEGYFLMGTGGATSAGDADELPQQQIYLPAYYIDKYPVTNRQFMEFVLRAGYKPSGGWDKYYTPGTADLPVRGVTWEDATAYAQWAHKRLPTEAEWEKAARGADGRTYPWGEDWSADILPRGEVLYEIMTKPECASPYGVFGSCGLVWQWTASAFAPYPFDPDARSDKRVLRGGCYSNGRNVVRCANRYAEAPNVALNTFGFRCVKDVQ